MGSLQPREEISEKFGWGRFVVGFLGNLIGVIFRFSPQQGDPWPNVFRNFWSSLVEIYVEIFIITTQMDSFSIWNICSVSKRAIKDWKAGACFFVGGILGCYSWEGLLLLQTAWGTVLLMEVGGLSVWDAILGWHVRCAYPSKVL